MAEKLRVAEEGRRAVVIGVEEGQWLLFEEEEDSINQFEIFCEVVELVCYVRLSEYDYFGSDVLT